jgi:hypothetical protein
MNLIESELIKSIKEKTQESFAVRGSPPPTVSQRNLKLKHSQLLTEQSKFASMKVMNASSDEGDGSSESQTINHSSVGKGHSTGRRQNENSFNMNKLKPYFKFKDESK